MRLPERLLLTLPSCDALGFMGAAIRVLCQPLLYSTNIEHYIHACSNNRAETAFETLPLLLLTLRSFDTLFS